MTTAPPALPMFVINLASRPERLAAFREAFDPLGYSIERFAAIRPADGNGVQGCAQSHLSIIRMAKERRYPWVAIFEDDAVPYAHFKEEFARLLPLLWKHRGEWDIFNGGPIDIHSVFRIENNLLKLDNCACTQTIIINSSAYDAILTRYGKPDAPEAIDMFYKLFRLVSSAPPLTYQSNTPSDIQTDHTIGASQEFVRAYRRLEAFRVVSHGETPYKTSGSEAFRITAPAPAPPTSSAPSSAPASARRILPYGGAGRRR